MVEMLQAGSRDVGFAGADWVRRARRRPGRAGRHRPQPGAPGRRRHAGVHGQRWTLVESPSSFASEYESLTRAWLEKRNFAASVLRSFGTTEVFPPEDADYIVDVTATGATLEANNLVIVDELMASSTRLYANAAALDDTARRDAIERFVLVIGAVLEARKRGDGRGQRAGRPARGADRRAALHARADSPRRFMATRATRSRRRCRATAWRTPSPRSRRAAAPILSSPRSPRSCPDHAPREVDHDRANGRGRA